MKMRFSRRAAPMLAVALCLGTTGLGPMPVLARQDASFSLTRKIDPALPYATLNGKDYSIHEVAMIGRARSPRGVGRRLATTRELIMIDADTRDKFLKGIAIEEKLSEIAKGLDYELSDRYHEFVEADRQRFAENLIFQEEVEPLIPQMTEEEVQAYYDLHKDVYTMAKYFRFQTLFLSTYQKHVVEEGESLRSIAAKISGDETAFERILSDETKRPRIEFLDPPVKEDELQGAMPTPPPEAEKIPPRALVVGEVLLVPMSKAEREKVKDTARRVIESIRGGEAFEELVREFSETQAPGEFQTFRPGKDRPILKALEDAMSGLKDGEVSEPIETRHGFHIVRLDRKEDERVLPLQEVRTGIERELNRQRRKTGIDGYFASLMEKFADQITIHDAALAATGEAAKPEDVLIEIADLKLTRREFDRDMTTMPEDLRVPSSGTTAQVFRNALLSTPTSMRKLVAMRIAERSFADHPDMLFSQEQWKIRDLANQYIDKKIEAALATINAETIRAEYDNRVEMYKRGPSVKLHEILIPRRGSEMTPEEFLEANRKVIEDRLAKVANLEDFKKIAMEISQGAEGKNGGELLMLEIEKLSPQIMETVKAMSVGEYSPILSDDIGLRVLYLAKRTGAYTIPFEEVEAMVRQDLEHKARESATIEALAEGEAIASWEPIGAAN